MRKGMVVLLAAILVAAFALPAMAEISFFGTAKVKPTYYDNFDFDDNTPDRPALNEGGWASGEHIRSELRLGWKAGGDKWKIMMLAEDDIIWDKNYTDRSFYVANDASGNYPQGLGVPNAGGEFSIERAEFVYTFSPMFELAAGWPISEVDIKSGGLLYGDDHPMLQLRGALAENVKYELTYLSIQNLDQPGVINSPLTNDWRVYSLKVIPTFGAGDAKFSVAPLVLLSDNRQRNASVVYYGVEALGQFGIFKPSFEFIYADGEFRNTSTDIKSYAGFLGVEAAVSKALTPYVAFRYAKGDDNGSDNKVEGFVGITDIGRFTPLMGMDGNILGEHLASGASPYNSPLYSYAPDRDGSGAIYGGIGNASSGNNPGQKLIAIGAKGALSDALSYKTQLFLIWYDKVGQIPVGAGKTVSSVDKYAGTTFDLQVAYKFSKNFSADIIYSTFVPGDGIKDQLASTADDTIAQLASLTLAWSY